MTTWIEPELWLNGPARASLARGLDALEGHTEAPLRVRAHAHGCGPDLFDVQEEFELGPRGRRFLVSVDAAETLLLTMSTDRGVHV